MQRDGAWYHADDDDVAEVPERMALAQQAYMLWYCASAVGEEQHSSASAARSAAHREAGAADEARRRQAVVAEVLNRREAGAVGRAVLGIPEHTGAETAMEGVRGALWLVHPRAGDKHDQRREAAAAALIEAREAMAEAHGKAVAAVGAARARRAQAEAAAMHEWEKARERAPVPQEVPDFQCVDEHQCPPFRARAVPVGTGVRVTGSARRRDGRQRGRIALRGEEGGEAGGEQVWHGVVVGQVRTDLRDYLVASCETRTWEDGYDPFTAPHGVIRVAWTNITVTGGPASGSEGAARWADYERQRAAETERFGGRAATWTEDRRMCAAAEQRRAIRGQEKMERRAAAARAERAEVEERGARFAAAHERLRGEAGPRGDGARVAHAGGRMTTNTEEALAKFVARMNKGGEDGGGDSGSAKRARETGESEDARAKKAKAAELALAAVRERKRKCEAEAQAASTAEAAAAARADDGGAEGKATSGEGGTGAAARAQAEVRGDGAREVPEEGGDGGAKPKAKRRAKRGKQKCRGLRKRYGPGDESDDGMGRDATD